MSLSFFLSYLDEALIDRPVKVFANLAVERKHL